MFAKPSTMLIQVYSCQTGVDMAECYACSCFECEDFESACESGRIRHRFRRGIFKYNR